VVFVVVVLIIKKLIARGEERHMNDELHLNDEKGPADTRSTGPAS
jgi:hypothetical protein